MNKFLINVQTRIQKQGNKRSPHSQKILISVRSTHLREHIHTPTYKYNTCKHKSALSNIAAAGNQQQQQ